jgi:hypothetical protein
MFEAIKNLSPSHRFQAFLVVVILSTLSSIGTVYLSTDDCSGLSNQYKTLVDNYTHTLEINNKLIKENNEKKEDLIYVSKLIDSLLRIEVKTKKISKVTNDNQPRLLMKSPSIDTLLYSAPRIVSPDIITIENTVIKNQLNEKQESIIHKVKNLTSKYDK